MGIVLFKELKDNLISGSRWSDRVISTELGLEEMVVKTNSWAISSDTHQLHYSPLHHFINYLTSGEALMIHAKVEIWQHC